MVVAYGKILPEKLLNIKKMPDSPDRHLNQFFVNSDYSKINIPIFQRPYSWEAIQLDQFLNDVVDRVLLTYAKAAEN